MTNQVPQRSPFTKDVMFQVSMKNPQSLRIARQIIEMAVQRKINKINFAGIERTEIPEIHAKYVRYDVLFEGDNTLYNIEMQNYTKIDLAKRARYYHDVLDAMYIKKGMDYVNIPNTILIYILTFDYKQYGEPITIDETYSKGHFEKPVDDGVMTVYMNATAHSDNEELNAFYKFLMTNIPTSAMTEELNSIIIESSKSLEYRRMVMNRMEIEEEAEKKGVEKGIQQGIQKGSKEATNAIALNMLENNEPIEKIFKFTGLTKDQLEELKKVGKEG